MDIGRKLESARKAIGYTLEKASEKSGISAPTISAYEHCGTPTGREPKFSQLSKLAEVYRKTIDFFLSDEPLIENLMLWRDSPCIEEEIKQTEAEFRQLCQQYNNLELVMCAKRSIRLPEPEVTRPEEFNFTQANLLAEKTQKEFLLGDIPSMSLKQTLEEKFYVKIFHLDFSGSAISTVSEQFGPAILLNRSGKSWRRNFDLAHELFHILTWSVFRTEAPENAEPGSAEEKLANAFASRLLLPTDSVKNKIDSTKGTDGKISFEALDEIAREFGVSLDTLLWRMLYLYNKSGEDIEEYIEKAKSLKINRPLRQSDEPDKLPERYCSLAIRALNEGKLSLMQFAKYMDMSYKQAGEYLAENEDFKDEKISISVA